MRFSEACLCVAHLHARGIASGKRQCVGRVCVVARDQVVGSLLTDTVATSASLFPMLLPY